MSFSDLGCIPDSDQTDIHAYFWTPLTHIYNFKQYRKLHMIFYFLFLFYFVLQKSAESECTINNA